jgi:imidazole glycerol-phosphate synthase subunit HisH
MIAIIDYDMGNVRSISNAVEYIGYDAVVTSDIETIHNANHLILPGVGAFGIAIDAICEKGLNEVLNKEVIENGKPMLGICLGLQLLARNSNEHGAHKGLGWLDAEVVPFLRSRQFKNPHIGWNDIEYDDACFLFRGLKKDERSFYFVHSFHLACNNPTDVLATCSHGIEFTAAIHKDNFVATQFHPEKSQDNGIQVLKNFLEWNP